MAIYIGYEKMYSYALIVAKNLQLVLKMQKRDK